MAASAGASGVASFVAASPAPPPSLASRPESVGAGASVDVTSPPDESPGASETVASCGPPLLLPLPLLPPLLLVLLALDPP